MKILKKFDSYIKEDLAMAEPDTKPLTAPATPTVEPGTKPERRDRPTPIRRDRPSVDPDPQAKMKIDATEEEGTYIGTQMLQDLADALSTEVMDNSVQYEGKTINFYSETEKFHVDKKKFTTVEEVVAYLTGGNSDIKKEVIETEEDQMIEDENMEDDLINSDEETWAGNNMDMEDDREIKRERHIKEFENFMYDEEDLDDDFDEFEEESFGDEYQGEDEEEDEYQYRVKSEKPEWMWNEDEEELDSDEEMENHINLEEDEESNSVLGRRSGKYNGLNYTQDEMDTRFKNRTMFDESDEESDECVPCRESHVTKKFNNFK